MSDMTLPPKMTLNTICDGKAEAMFQRELNRLLERIHDPSADPDAKQEIALKVTIIPERSDTTNTITLRMVMETSCKLSASRGKGGVGYTGVRTSTGEIVAEAAPIQGELGGMSSDVAAPKILSKLASGQ
jgi:hypothetical protein